MKVEEYEFKINKTYYKAKCKIENGNGECAKETTTRP